MSFSEKTFDKLKSDTDITILVCQAIEAINTEFYDNVFF